MTGANESFTSIGMPSGAAPDDTVDKRVGLHLLETLDALASVCESAAFFATTVGAGSIADYTLERCLQSGASDCGALYLDDGERLELKADRQGASAVLDVGALPGLAELPRVAFHNGRSATGYLLPAAGERNVLLAPIAAGQRRIGIVVILKQPGAVFQTVEAKLVAAVTSQAAIALSSALHLRDVEIERSKLRAVIEQHPLGIVVLRADCTTMLCNSFARQLCGLPDDVSPDLDVAAELARQGGISREDLLGDAAIGEIEFGTGFEGRLIGFQTSEIRDSAGKLANFILTLHDLTEQRREERLKRDFVSMISHKFRTPITTILGVLMLLEECDVNDRGELIEEARRRADHLGMLVDRLLYFTEIIEGSWSTRGRTDLLELRVEIDTQFAGRFGQAGLVIEWDVADDARVVAMPPSRVRVMLDNLIENAIKFGHPAEPWARVTSRSAGDGWMTIQVEDRGPGIPQNEQSRVFQSFYQRDEEFTGNVPGAGIGLAMVAGIVRRIGGRIEVRAGSARGSVFTLTIPSESRELSVRE